jgi:hypothetical protein
MLQHSLAFWSAGTYHGGERYQIVRLGCLFMNGDDEASASGRPSLRVKRLETDASCTPYIVHTELYCLYPPPNVSATLLIANIVKGLA